MKHLVLYTLFVCLVCQHALQSAVAQETSPGTESSTDQDAGDAATDANQPSTDAVAPDADETMDANADQAIDDAPALFRLDYSGDIWTRPALTGDWNGLRNKLAAEDGISFELEVEQLIQGSAFGGKDTNNAFRYSGSWDMRLKVDTGRMDLWPGGLFDIHVESFFGDGLGDKVGSPVNDDALFPIPGSHRVALSHVTYTQFLSESFAIFMGKLDTSQGDENEFAWIHGDNFLHTSLRWNPISARTTPYSTLGLGFLATGEWGRWTFMVFDSEGEPEAAGFDTAFDGGTAIATEARFNVDLFGKKGHQLVGFVYSDRLFLASEQDPRVGLRTGSGLAGRILQLAGSFERESGSWAFFYNFDQYIYTEAEDESQGIGLFGRFGISDGDANPIHSFYSVGIGGKGIVPERDNDTFGLGYFYTKWSDTALADALNINDSQGVELFYNIEVTPWLHITPDLQVLINPGGDADRDVALVYGLRAHMTF
ncbi:MAG: carbohydrate porin [Phycisphaerae bacterium]